MTKTLDKELVGEVLQRIYDSELHLSIGWMWDGGIDYRIGCDLHYLKGDVVSTDNPSVSEAVQIMANDISEKYPDSVFAKWWSEIISENAPEIFPGTNEALGKLKA